MKDLENLTSKLAEICNCDVRKTITDVVGDLSNENDILTQTHIKKGGCNNSEVFYNDYLEKPNQAKLKKNGLSQEEQLNNQIWKIWKSAWLIMLPFILKGWKRHNRLLKRLLAKQKKWLK